ncbi:flagellar filament capping protein FliD [Lacrimispora sp.]|uniref:flagellar filament capping protein FliD n=1 Tax=Lacrimispora sp. TaxID=2719234 RepID=UPI0028B0F050|nr:flagellar filament capping protein FliD [Lacrimispora sp.]
MASVSTTNKINSASTVRGYGGLASGLDRDSLIEGMTASTRAKIAKQNKSRQTALWKQEAYQSVSSKLVEFSKKYMSYTNPATNLSSSSIWASSSITTNGANSKYVSVTGSSSISNSLSIVGVKSMAQDAYKVSANSVSDSTLSSETIDFGMKDVSNLEGEYLTFKYGSKTYNVTMQTGKASDGTTYDYSNTENAAKSINKSLEQVSIGNGKTLADVIKVSSYDSGGVSKLDIKSENTAGNTVLLESGSESALKALGFDDIKKVSEADRKISDTGFSDTVKGYTQELTTPKTFLERTKGKNISFTYNGVTKSIQFGDKTNITDLAKDLKDKLAKQFGDGRIDVQEDGGKLVFKTKVAGTNADDNTSVLSITSADKGILGTNGELGITAGESNRLNLESSVADSGLESMKAIKSKPGYSEDNLINLKINGVSITGLSYKSSMKEIMDKINSSDAGVKVSYISNSDKFTFQSTVAGASGKVDFEEDAEALFGDNDTGFDVKEGKDAVVTVKYGDGATQELVRGSNSFNLEGLNVTVNGTFGYKSDGSIDTAADPVTLTAKTNSDKIVSTITDMIKDYNDIIQLVSDQVSKKPNRDYSPLTDEQKESMTEDQIKKWEDKAKVGVLFNDTDLRSLSDSLRFVFDAGSDEKAMLSSFGISTSSDYTEKGKLVFDETKFRAALEKNPEDIKKLFTKKADTSTGEKDGFMAKLTSITNKFANTAGAVKGILIEKAGSVYAPTSVTSNSIQKSIDSIDVYIKKLQTQLKTETDRYVKQFTNLENVIAQMNSQSSTLSSFGS